MFKSLILTALLASANASFDKIGGDYEPQTSVTDHNAIDLDQKEIENLLGTPNPATYQLVKDVFEKGGNSKTVATVTLTTPLTVQLGKGTQVTGTTVDGGVASLTMFAAASAGATSVELQYQASTVQEQSIRCKVGGLQASSQVREGCLAISSDLTFDGVAGSFPYTYTVESGNRNTRTIQGFSTDADNKFRPANGGEFFDDFMKFVDYYGDIQFGDEWVSAAIEGRDTQGLTNGAKFSGYSDSGRVQAIKKGTAYIVIANYVIRELDDAVDDCKNSCGTEECNEDAVHALDEAVAFWSGSLELQDGSGDGVLMNALADKRCANFKTCGENSNSAEGRSYVNIELYKLFNQMKTQLRATECANAEQTKKDMIPLMITPLIQGTLRYADLLNREEYSQKSEAEGATFAAGVLPYVHACNAGDAQTIYDQMQVGKRGDVDYDAVYGAFSRQFGCLGVTADQVGAPFDASTNTFFQEDGSSARAFSVVAVMFLSAVALFV